MGYMGQILVGAVAFRRTGSKPQLNILQRVKDLERKSYLTHFKLGVMNVHITSRLCTKVGVGIYLRCDFLFFFVIFANWTLVVRGPFENTLSQNIKIL